MTYLIDLAPTLSLPGRQAAALDGLVKRARALGLKLAKDAPGAWYVSTRDAEKLRLWWKKTHSGPTTRAATPEARRAYLAERQRVSRARRAAALEMHP